MLRKVGEHRLDDVLLVEGRNQGHDAEGLGPLDAR